MGINLLWQGAAIAILTLISYVIGAQTSPAAGTTMAFLTLSVCEMLHAWNMRSLRDSVFTMEHRNPMLLGSVLLSFVLTVPVALIPALQKIFSLVKLSGMQYVWAIVLAALIVPVVEIVKAFQRAGQKK
jgi:Ca2+-transporting ATPase